MNRSSTAVVEPRTQASRSTSPSTSACTCAQERALTVDAELALAPETGRVRWRSWTPALGRLLAELADGPAHVLIVTQGRNERYIEVLIGHGRVRLEASSNAVLHGDFKLSPSEEHKLELVGFHRPSDGNWWLEEQITMGEQLTELVTHVLVPILGLDPDVPIVVNRYGADRPCRSCTWGV